ncbi:MAG: efflux RND transporter periplasmic adaptor subunit [Acidobacteriota bacterium]|nr:efflux RND transporter periplasmic adaptor subunit [Acidobacteriota bacterium]
MRFIMSAALRVALLVALVAGGGWYVVSRSRPTVLVLTGIVTTHDIVIAPQIGGRIVALRVKEGDEVAAGQVVAEIEPGELAADRDYFDQSARGLASAVEEQEAALRYQRRQLDEQEAQAEAAIATTQASHAAAIADAERARITFERTRQMADAGLAPAQQLDETRTAHTAAEARVEALARQVDAERAALALVRASVEQIAMRRNQVATSQAQLAAVGAQQQKATVRLGFAQLTAPTAGIIDVVPAREGEVLMTGQAVATLVDPDDLWVRADIEETYIDRIRTDDTLTVRLPSGEERQGTVFYRRVDAGFATQRDVSRTKRDIKTFETRLRVDNRDRTLAVGMTIYVLLPVQ